MDPDFREYLENSEKDVRHEFELVKRENNFSDRAYRSAEGWVDMSAEEASTELQTARLINENKFELEMAERDGFWFHHAFAKRIAPSDKQEKVQVSMSETQKFLLDCWAKADGKSLSGVAAEAMSIGLAQLRKDQTIPQSALVKYQVACEARLVREEIASALLHKLP